MSYPDTIEALKGYLFWHIVLSGQKATDRPDHDKMRVKEC